VVADEEIPEPGPFNVETIGQLVKLMSRHDLAEILLQQGDARIRLRRGTLGPVVTATPTVVPVAAPVPTHAPQAAATTPSTPAAPTRKLHEIKSPSPGTFYAQEKPDSPPYVKAGSRVTPTTVVCKIEAMKLYNDIEAECTGTIVEVCVENAQPVEFGTVLFRVDTSG
jgi:acetyl-CoA carboxylase biotin carboxyl carrier protein